MSSAEQVFPWSVGDPINIAQDNDLKQYNPWVGYIMRIDYGTGRAVVAPERLLNSHLSVVRIDQLRKGKFTKRRHRDLYSHIEQLRVYDNIYAAKTDTARMTKTQRG